jgi:hypothetical protein
LSKAFISSLQNKNLKVENIKEGKDRAEAPEMSRFNTFPK